MRTQEILDQIDAAIDDWSVSPDAMRANTSSIPGALRIPLGPNGFADVQFEVDELIQFPIAQSSRERIRQHYAITTADAPSSNWTCLP